MMMKPLCSTLAAALVAITLPAHALTLPVSEDTSTTTVVKTAKVAGKATSLPVSATRNALVRFEVGAFGGVISADNVSSARLVLFIQAAKVPGDLTVRAVTSDWSEVFSSTAAVPTMDPGVLGTILQAQVVAKQFVLIDVTAQVKAWLAAPATDFGFAITASGLTNVLLGSKEGSGTGYPATLEIDTPLAGVTTVDGALLAAGSVGSNQLASNLTLGGTTVFNGGINLPVTTAADTGVVAQDGVPLLHTFGTHNFFAGPGAGNFAMTGTFNTALGGSALSTNVSGSNNIAIGNGALQLNTGGSQNIALGNTALFKNLTGNFNLGICTNALASNTSGNRNLALGPSALFASTTGNFNLGIGSFALGSLTTGSGNIALGVNAGVSLTDTNNNIVIANSGVNGDSGIIRIGTNGTHTDTFLAGVIHGDGSALTDVGSINLPETLADFTTGVLRQGGSPLLSTFGFGNLFLGRFGANYTGTALFNTSVGYGALGSLTAGSGNTAVGNLALLSNTEGPENVALGHNALKTNTVGAFNVAVGSNALANLTNGASNVAIGSGAMQANVEGGSNVVIGQNALGNGTQGSLNVVIGYETGRFATGDGNILISNSSSGAENWTIRLGEAQTRAFIAGIRGTTTGQNDAIPVVIDSAGQLGTISSSRRYKEQIADMADASARLESLRPVTFRYKQPYANGDKPIQYGLIAEEVAEVFPELCVRNAEGNPETVKYQELPPLLLNEFLKERRRARDVEAEQAAALKRKDAEIEALNRRLEKLESLLKK